MDDASSLGGAILLLLAVLFLLAIIPAVIAAKKGRNPVIWYLYGLALWIVALVHAIMLPPKRRCRFCAEAIRPEAKVCPHCQRDLAIATEGAPRRPGLMLEGL
jgi:membrane protein YdbS with pleckstrin-like domain